ncbi:hypothetical protein [Kutzneria sp. NPDC052558]|uniref:hypothetical protein n=1 Tax=Kutzneria sp. NPDC052558 TaxID=3364121 RepID=UPI0037C991BF
MSAAIPNPDVRRELLRVAEAIEAAWEHHRAADTVAATRALGPVKPSPLTVRLEFASKGLRHLLAHDYPDTDANPTKDY